MTWCVRCGRMLSSRQLRYCSNACKQADYRDRIPYNRLADQALAVLRPPAESPVAGGVMDPGFDWRDRVAFIRTYYPEVFSTFGEDVLAASARPMPSAACRWCWAFATARVGNRKSVLTRAMVSTAARRLLGEPCNICRKRAFATIKRHIDAGRPESTGGAVRTSAGRSTSASNTPLNRAASPGTSALVMSPDPHNPHDPFDNCKTCKAYRRAHPNTTLTASGFPRDCPPHAWNESPRGVLPAWLRTAPTK